MSGKSAQSSSVAPAAPGLTADQQRGVQTVGKSLLLSAAAGSGKTRVLAERCAYLVCDAPGPFRCNVDELLVVTFTEAAAAEMRERIGRALEARLKTENTPRLREQVALVEQSNISTLHSFCARLLRQHFHLVGLDPAFSVMDEHEARLLRLDVGRALLRDRYNRRNADPAGRSSPPGESTFARLLDGYFDGDDERLLHEILRLSDLLGSMVDGEGWFNESVDRIAEAANPRVALLTSEIGRVLIGLVQRGLADLGRRCNETIEALVALGQPEFDQYIERAVELRDISHHLYKQVGQAGLEAVSEEAEVTFARFKPVKSTVPRKDQAKALIDGLMEEYKSGGWRSLLRFTEREWKDGLTAILPFVHELRDLTLRFSQRYQEAKADSRQLDFGDLERLTKQLLLDTSRPGRRPSATARQYQRLFKHVLVDEYQDINAVQALILRLLSRDASDDPAMQPNLFCVGDVKQSIYRFRLADPAQFVARERELRDDPAGRGEVIDLRQNFRTRGPLLEAINDVFSRLMTESAVEIEYDETQRLVPGRKFGEAGDVPVFPGSPIELHLLTDTSEESAESAEPADDGDGGWDRTEREAAFVAKRILQIIGKSDAPAMHVYERGGDAPRPARYKDIVVLLRSKRYKANQFVRVFESFGIPVHAESGTGFFESQEIRDVVALLCLLDNQQQDLELATYLRSPLVRLPDAEDALARIRIAYPKRDGKPTFHDAVVRYADEKSDALAERLRAVLQHLSDLRQTANRQPVHDTIWQVYHDSGYLAYVSGLVNGRQRAANLLELYDRARSFGNHRRQGLGRFLEFLQSLEVEADLGQPSVGTEAADVVRVMTVHGSKGLEFPIVIVPDCGKRINTQDEAGPLLVDRTAGIGMPVADLQKRVRYPSLAELLVKDRIHRKLLAEELRVLYVAMTRAMEHLILVGTAEASKPDAWKQAWSGHAGPLPESAVVGARTLLDWLGPVWAAEADTSAPCLELQVHSASALDADRPGQRRAARSAVMDDICALRPVGPERAPQGEAATVVQRLGFVYPFESAVARPAVTRVTALAKPADAEPASFAVPPAVAGVSVETASGALELPRFLAGQRPAAAADIGSAVHLVLQHLRFAGVKSADDIRHQAADMAASSLLRAELYAALTAQAYEDMAWFVLQTDIGRQIVANEPRLLREMPVVFTLPEPDAHDPRDLTMVRGRLDLFVPTADGGVIVDYKTDNIRTAEQMEQRVRLYREQVRLYGQSLNRLTGRQPRRAVLVFLRARRIETLDIA
jgi:ATP-dependent helicase/nuclease subunit A